MQTIHLDTNASEPRATTKAMDAITVGLARSKKAVLLVGAGISTNAGIPDFRSQGSGLYSPSSTSSTPSLLSKGPELFSAAVYRTPETASEHLRFIAAMKQSVDSIASSSSSAPPSPVTATHNFMGVLKKRGQLLRVYTQNIDAFEGVKTGLQAVPLEGLTPCSASASSGSASKGKGKAKLKNEGDFVQLHGSLHAVRCTGCEFVREWDEEDGESFEAGEVGSCPQCEERATIRLLRGQRPLSSLQRAFLRPSITLYDEAPIAALTIGSLSLADLSSNPDFMIVMGTTLRIPGFKKLVKEFARAVKARGGVRVLVNREEIGSKSEWKDVFDYQVLSDADSFVTRILDDWKQSRPRDWVGKQATLGSMFTATSKKGLADATAKPRRALSALSPNTSSSALPPPSSAGPIKPFSVFQSLPPLPTDTPEKRVLRSGAPPSSSSSSPPPSSAETPHPRSSKRKRFEDDSPATSLSASPMATPTKRRTRNSLRAADEPSRLFSPSSSSPAFASHPLPLPPRSPPRAAASRTSRGGGLRSPLAPKRTTSLSRPSEAVLLSRMAAPYKPPRWIEESARIRVVRTPSPCPEGEGTTISPDLW
ncbi:hypothetical protein JCM8097_005345 [Rhodosporidiobolus ruineniae]